MKYQIDFKHLKTELKNPGESDINFYLNFYYIFIVVEITNKRDVAFGLLTFPFSKSWVIMTMTWVSCFRTIFQKDKKML